MEPFYVKIGRKYQPVNFFSGFPANGIWLVQNNARSFIMTKSQYSPIKVAFMLRLDNLVNHICRNGYDDNFVDVFQIPVKEMEHIPFRPETVDNIYQKKKDRYYKIGQSFIGFPHSGVFDVYDGKNNGITFLGHFSDYPEIDIEKLKPLVTKEKIEIMSNMYRNKSIHEFSSAVLMFLAEEYVQ